MPLSRFNYYKRIFATYFLPTKSHLTFWHSGPEVNPNMKVDELGEYYMSLAGKADYPGQVDDAGIPMLDYHAAIGLQYNPIAIAQFGLGNYNLFCQFSEDERRQKFLLTADWLVENLEQNPAGLWVWNHHFDWEYRRLLKAPWYSALAQGQGLSLLARAHLETGEDRYLEVARRAYEPFVITLDEGGVAFIDQVGYIWFEEYIVSPLLPTHVLNGFIWATWGIYDFYLTTGDSHVRSLFDDAIRTIADNLQYFDIGFWSLYEQSGTYLKMIASSFYHRLHIVQLQVLYRLTSKDVFRQYMQRWENYQAKPLNKNVAKIYKWVFKFFYY